MLELTRSTGAKATSRATAAASSWLESTWPIIEKAVLQRADEGLFHCRMRFEDTIPQDPATQRRLVKLLRSHNLVGSFTHFDGGVELAMRWGPAYL